MGDDLLLLVGLALSFALAIFLAAAETSLLRVSPVRVAALAAEGRSGARVLEHLIERLSQVLNAILLAALLTQIAAATIVGMLAEHRFGALGVTISSVVLTIALFIYAEAIPKTYAVRNADRVAPVIAVPVSLLERGLRPFVSVLVWVADLQMPGKGIEMSPTVTEQELRLLASSALDEGQITHMDFAFIERAFRFGDRRADDVMIPRTEVVGVEAASTVEEALGRILEAGHRRIVVFDRTIEQITGVVDLRSLAAGIDAPNRPVAELAAEPLVVPESVRIADLLAEMQEQKIHLAVVVDEYGGTAGIVTLDDIAHQLLGSITRGRDLVGIRRLESGVLIVQGSVPIEDLGEVLGRDFDGAEWNTAAGLALHAFGRIPRQGDSVTLDDLTIRATSVRRHRVLEIRIEQAEAPTI